MMKYITCSYTNIKVLLFIIILSLFYAHSAIANPLESGVRSGKLIKLGSNYQDIEKTIQRVFYLGKLDDLDGCKRAILITDYPKAPFKQNNRYSRMGSTVYMADCYGGTIAMHGVEGTSERFGEG